MQKGLISCVLCTYGRFTQVQRSISMFLDQSAENKELLVFNTAPIPLETDLPVTVINNDLSYVTGKPYTSIGEIRRDALLHARGEFYVCWDDDDWYYPDHLARVHKKLIDSGMKAWKPKVSYWSNDGGKTLAPMENNMEASIIVQLDQVAFRETTGDEHLFWLERLRKLKQIDESENVRPTYAYIWGDGLHKQSGALGHANNFENHKKESVDFGDGRLKRLSMGDVYRKFDHFNAIHYSPA